MTDNNMPQNNLPKNAGFLKGLVLTLGLILLTMFVVLVFMLVDRIIGGDDKKDQKTQKTQQLNSTPSSVIPDIKGSMGNIKLNEGERIVETDIAGNNILVRVEDTSGKQFMLIYDLQGNMISRINIQ